MQQRLGIAQALVGAPRILLLDEPTSALDPAAAARCASCSRTSARRGVSVLLNSHLLSEVELVCDRVVILLAGKVVAEAETDELAHPRGVEIETQDGHAARSRAPREDEPRLVAELGRRRQADLQRPGRALDARGGLPRGGGD